MILCFVPFRPPDSSGGRPTPAQWRCSHAANCVPEKDELDPHSGCFSAPCSHMLFVPFAIGFAGVHHSQPVCRCKGKWNTPGVPLHLQPVRLYGMHANPMNSERNSKSIWKKEAERCSNQTSKKEKRSPPKKLRNLKSIWAPPLRFGGFGKNLENGGF